MEERPEARRQGLLEGLLGGQKLGAARGWRDRLFQGRDWCSMLHKGGGDAEENRWCRQEGGATGGGPLSQGDGLALVKASVTCKSSWKVPVGRGAGVGSRGQGRNPPRPPR